MIQTARSKRKRKDSEDENDAQEVQFLAHIFDDLIISLIIKTLLFTIFYSNILY
jgi:hypothetical protein